MARELEASSVSRARERERAVRKHEQQAVHYNALPSLQCYYPSAFSSTFPSPPSPANAVLLGGSGTASKLTPLLPTLPKLSLLPSLLPSLKIPGRAEVPSLLRSWTLVRRRARDPAGDMLKVAKGSTSRGVLGVWEVGVEGTVATKSQEVMEAWALPLAVRPRETGQ